MKKTLFTIFSLAIATSTIAQITFQASTLSSANLPTGRSLRTLIDVDNDNQEDFFASVNSTGMLELYRNNGNGTFVSANFGFTRNVMNATISRADFNNDSYPDFVVMYTDSIFFYENTQNNSFINVTQSQASLNAQNKQYFGEASPGLWDDYDDDGDLDFLFASKNASNSFIEVLVNNLNNSFNRVVLLTFNLPITPAFNTIDYDGDKDQDLVMLYFNNNNPPLAQYNYQPMRLYQKNGMSYTDVSAGSGLTLGSNHGFINVWDYNNDGHLDLIMGSTDNVFNSAHVNRVYKNMGNGTFTDVSTTLNLKNGNSYYRSVELSDFDNNSFTDVLYTSTNHLFSGNNGTFSNDVISTSGLGGVSYPTIIDLNNDGKMDLISNDLTPFVNNSNSGNYLKVKLIGCPNLQDPRGTIVKMFVGGQVQTRYLSGTHCPWAYYGANSSIIHFGIGANQQIDSLYVGWVNGNSATYTNLTVNALNVIYQSGTSSSIAPNACVTYLAPDGNVYNQSGIYTAVIPNSVGCDSTISIDLTINDHTFSTQTQTALDSYTWPVNGQTYTQSGMYTDTLQNAAGCDSVVTLNLTLSFTGIETLHLNGNKKLLKITDLNGKETPYRKNTVLLFIYEDGTIERIYEAE